MIRGVRIIPEVDTPGHAASWRKAPQNKGIACLNKDSKYKGSLDVTLHKTYELVK
jgi:N-acetyl-beta-hexosaminidase